MARWSQVHMSLHHIWAVIQTHLFHMLTVTVLFSSSLNSSVDFNSPCCLGPFRNPNTGFLRMWSQAACGPRGTAHNIGVLFSTLIKFCFILLFCCTCEVQCNKMWKRTYQEEIQRAVTVLRCQHIINHDENVFFSCAANWLKKNSWKKCQSSVSNHFVKHSSRYSWLSPTMWSSHGLVTCPGCWERLQQPQPQEEAADNGWTEIVKMLFLMFYVHLKFSKLNIFRSFYTDKLNFRTKQLFICRELKQVQSVQ